MTIVNKHSSNNSNNGKLCFLLDCDYHMKDYKRNVLKLVLSIIQHIEVNGQMINTVYCFSYSRLKGGITCILPTQDNRGKQNSVNIATHISKLYIIDENISTIEIKNHGIYDAMEEFFRNNIIRQISSKFQLLMFSSAIVKNMDKSDCNNKIEHLLSLTAEYNALPLFVYPTPFEELTTWMDSRIPCVPLGLFDTELFFDGAYEPVTHGTLLNMLNDSYKRVEKQEGPNGSYCYAYRVLNQDGIPALFLKESILCKKTDVFFNNVHNMQWSELDKQRAQHSWHREINALESLDYLRGIPRLIDYYEKNNTYYIIEEYYHGHMLCILMEQAKMNRVSSSKVNMFLYRLFLNMAVLLCRVHNAGFIHQDVSVNNILVRSLDDPNDFVLSDWGQARTIVENDASNIEWSGGNNTIDPWFEADGFLHPCNDVYKLGGCALKALELFYGDKCDLESVVDPIFADLIRLSTIRTYNYLTSEKIYLWCVDWVYKLSELTRINKNITDADASSVWMEQLSRRRPQLLSKEQLEQRKQDAAMARPIPREARGDPSIIYG